MNTPIRKFEDIAATREQVPLLVGLVGPSGSGKTFSALRLATGIQKVTGGDIYGIDTESRRMLHYADAFKFRHLQFGEPFSPLDYLAAIQHCVNKGAKTIIIDSMSHEHEGPGGVLEMHEQAMGGDFKKQFIAWAKPKAMRRRLINSMLQLNCNFIMAYRAKEKLKVMRGKEPEPRGWQPIAGEEYVYEATLNCLLLPGSNGVPCWNPEHDNEGMIKLPSQFRGIFEKGPQLDESIGAKLAEWSKGGAAPSAQVKPTADQPTRATAEQVKALSDKWKASRGANEPSPEAFVYFVDSSLGYNEPSGVEWFTKAGKINLAVWTADDVQRCMDAIA
jgi:ABC-type dipeptide/oligopeptide/nickel transport system ATPase subunit